MLSCIFDVGTISSTCRFIPLHAVTHPGQELGNEQDDHGGPVRGSACHARRPSGRHAGSDAGRASGRGAQCAQCARAAVATCSMLRRLASAREGALRTLAAKCFIGRVVRAAADRLVMAGPQGANAHRLAVVELVVCLSPSNRIANGAFAGRCVRARHGVHRCHR